MIPVERCVAFEIQWPPRGVPIDPSPQALPDSQFVMLPVLNTLNQPSNPKLIISHVSQTSPRYILGYTSDTSRYMYLGRFLGVTLDTCQDTSGYVYLGLTSSRYIRIELVRFGSCPCVPCLSRVPCVRSHTDTHSHSHTYIHTMAGCPGSPLCLFTGRILVERLRKLLC